MSSYVGRHAQLYDLFYGDKPYAAEAQFIDQQLQAAGVKPGSNLLDVACGTARHAIEFARLGYRVTGVDYSEDMLKRARHRVAESGFNIDLQQQDMRSLDLGLSRFDAITCLFDSIGYVLTNQSVSESLGRLHQHLNPCGIIAIEFWHAAAMLRSYDAVRARRWSTSTGEVLRISETTLDVARQTSTVAYSVYELRPDGTYSSFQETQQNRYFLVQEMSALLKAASLEPLQWFSGFSSDQAIDHQTWHVVVLARKA